jgi:hypothetical protein
MDINKATIEELTKALFEKKIDQAKAESLIRLARNADFIEALPSILPLLKHDRKSCKSGCNNGFHREHRVAYCTKCVLENIEDWNSEDLQIDFDIRITQISGR